MSAIPANAKSTIGVSTSVGAIKAYKFGGSTDKYMERVWIVGNDNSVYEFNSVFNHLLGPRSTAGIDGYGPMRVPVHGVDSPYSIRFSTAYGMIEDTVITVEAKGHPGIARIYYTERSSN